MDEVTSSNARSAVKIGGSLVAGVMSVLAYLAAHPETVTTIKENVSAIGAAVTSLIAIGAAILAVWRSNVAHA